MARRRNRNRKPQTPTPPTPTPPSMPANYQPKMQLLSNNAVVEEAVYRHLERLMVSEHTDKRLVAVARTQLELGFLVLAKAVIQPPRSALPGDPVPPASS